MRKTTKQSTEEGYEILNKIKSNMEKIIASSDSELSSILDEINARAKRFGDGLITFERLRIDAKDKLFEIDELIEIKSHRSK